MTTDYPRQQILRDFKALQAHHRRFWEGVPGDAWEKRTGTREKDWTLHEALAHLVSIAVQFNRCLEAGLAGHDTLEVDGLAQREDLAVWNAVQIANLSAKSPETLVNRLLAAFDEAREKAGKIDARSAGHEMYFPVYSRPAPLADVVAWQFSHAGVIHGAQIARPLANAGPLWERYGDGLRERMTDRFMRHFSYAYWPEFGGDLEAAVNMRVEGGGTWHLVANPAGGDTRRGASEGAVGELQFASEAALFGVFTVEIPLQEALANGQLKIEGNPADVMKIIQLYKASPPG